MRPREIAGLVLIAAATLGFVAYVAHGALSFIPDDHVGSATIPPGEFASFEFVVYGRNHELSYRFAVESGPEVDIYLLTLDDFARYESGQPLEDSRALYEGVRRVDGSPYFDEGRYRAVIDNTDYGVAQPYGVQAVVRYDFHAGGTPGQDPFTRLATTAFVGLVALGVLVLGILVACLPPSKLFTPPVICRFCGRPSGRWRCPQCGQVTLPALLARPVAGKVRRGQP